MKKQKSKNIFKAFGAWLKESVRKFFVALKKNPQLIPLTALIVTFLHYSLNLTHISDTTVTLAGPNMGFAAFVSMLALLLSFVCMLNAFPKRQKPRITMILVMVVLYGAVIFAENHYLTCINNATNREVDPVVLTDFMIKARDTVSVNIILVGITAVLMLLEPVVAKLLKKIKTSIDVEEGEEIAEIDISEEE